MNMGYRSQNNRDAAERAAWRKLPLHARYDWPVILAVIVVIAAFAAGLAVRSIG
ncbi:hypothetical protein DES32_0851 [Methylovirgula ligni]|uniref:Uncharacterized protein n=1 Tax=Methylovirgula ligni TaxID=569860 RepID=A0A3D9Z372_9HYPH|nr:hypothetical protein [Methylovirgula ligni]REF89624.1 hypothetical protein DES32_0851 [Methylovirgula ligni]